MPKRVAQKVVIYTVSNGQLLVFRHVDFSYEEVGIQVPAGSIRQNETPTEAALRELREETGYDDFEIVAALGTAMYDITPYREELQERHFFLAKPTAILPKRWYSKEEHDGQQSPTEFECFWIPIAHGHVLQSGHGALLWKVSEVREGT